MIGNGQIQRAARREHGRTACISLTFISIANGVYNDVFDLLFLPGNGVTKFTSAMSMPIQGMSYEPNLKIQQINCDFGEVREGQVASQSIKCSNHGDTTIRTSLITKPPFYVSKSHIDIGPSGTNIDLTYRPESGLKHTGLLYVVFDNIQKPVLLLGRSGRLSLNSSLGPPSIHCNDNPKFSRKADIIDLGIVDTGKEVKKTLRLINDGTINVWIAQISSTEGLQWSTSVNDEMIGLDRVKKGLNFGDEDGDMFEVDWDEVDYQLASEKNSLNVLFPVCLGPGQSLSINITLNTENVIGEFFSSLEIWCVKYSSQNIKHAENMFTFDFKAISQPSLQFNSLHSELGPVSIQDSKVEIVSFTNIGVVPVPWALVVLESKVSPALPQSLSNRSNDDLEAITASSYRISKDLGTLKPGKTQEITIYFEPSLPHTICQMKLGLISDLFNNNNAESTFSISGIGASPFLRLNDIKTTEELSEMFGKHTVNADENLQKQLSVNFGSIKLATKKKKSVMLVNCGALDGHFRIENISSRFTTTPREGTIRAQSFRRIDIFFEPLFEKVFNDVIRVTWGGGSDQDLTIHTMGSGGHPSLQVTSKSIDFQVALLNLPSRQELTLLNNGNAETFVDIELPLKHYIRTEPVAPIIVEPHSSRTIIVVFTPRKLFTLNCEMRVQSLENKHDVFYVKLLGTVGQPQLEIHPPNTMAIMNYGTALIDKCHKKTFLLENKGNLDCLFRCFFVKPKSQEHLQRAYALLNESPKSYSQIDDDDKNDNVQTRDFIGNSTIKLTSLTSETIEALYLRAPDHFEVCLSDVFDVCPKEGVLEEGNSVHFQATFSPIEREISVLTILIIETPFRTFVGKMEGVGGQPSLVLDNVTGAIDFGVCRAGGKYERVVNIINMGNVEYAFELLPDPHDLLLNPRHKPPGFSWQRVAESNGFRLKSSGICKPYGTTAIKIIFSPSIAGIGRQKDLKFIVKYMSGTHAFRVLGNSSMPELSLCDISKRPIEGKTVQIGFHRVGNVHTEMFTLSNSGPVPSMFYISHSFTEVFHVMPESGHVPSNGEKQLKITFQPNKPGEFKFRLTILTDAQTSMNLNIVGSGGATNIKQFFVNSKDRAMKGLDFDLVKVDCVALKTFVLANHGQVEANVSLTSSSPYFTLKELKHEHAQVSKSSSGENYTISGINSENILSPLGDMIINIKINPNEDRVVAVLLKTQEEGKHYAAEIIIDSEFHHDRIPARGIAGSVKFFHDNELNFGKIACNHTYTKRLTIHNRGTLLTGVSFYWNLPEIDCKPMATDVRMGSSLASTMRGNRVQMKTYKSNLVHLKSTGTSIGRRRFWKHAIRQVIMMNKFRTLMVGSYRNSKQLSDGRRIKNSTQPEASKSGIPDIHRFSKTTTTNPKPPIANMNHAQELLRNKGIAIQQKLSKYIKFYKSSMRNEVRDYAQAIERVQYRGSYSMDTRGQMVTNDTVKNTQKLVNDTPETNAPVYANIPHVQVTPSHCTLSHAIAEDIVVSVHISRPGRFKASLLLASGTASVEHYAIPLSFVAEVAEMVFCDTSPLNFGILSIGSSSTLKRSLTNKSNLRISFRVHTSVDGLTITPSHGSLNPGMSLQIRFKFRPMESRCYDGEISFDSDCSNNLSLGVIGSGGRSKLTMPIGATLDFGRCMMGTVMSRCFPVCNEGDALLTFQCCDIVGLQDTEEGTFRLSTEWPLPGTNVAQGDTVELKIEFVPRREEIASGLLTMRTSDGNYHINLFGTGREVSVQLSKKYLAFTKCIVGNNYQHSIRVSNRGDTVYTAAVSIRGDPSGALKAITKEIVVKPFSHDNVIVAYEPTQETNREAYLVLGSEQFNQIVPISIEAGLAELTIDPAAIDFGLFNKPHPPTDKYFKVKNVGSTTISFRIRRSDEYTHAPPYTLSQWKGRLPPGASCDIRASFCGDLGAFEENLFLESEMRGYVKYFVCRGVCSIPKLKFDDSQDEPKINFRTCVVGTRVHSLLKFQNTGQYPLKGKVVVPYPLSVEETYICIHGGCAGSIQVCWLPTREILLNETIKLSLNAGTYYINVTGKSVYSQLKVIPSFLDFGVRAIGTFHVRSLKLINSGECDSEWNIPTTPSNYGVSVSGGVLKKGESCDLEVCFSAKNTTPACGNFIVETRGRYSTVSVSGVGGVANLLCVPSSLQLGSRKKGERIESVVIIKNTGEVRLNLRLGQGLPSTRMGDDDFDATDPLCCLETSFGPLKNQWPRLTVHPNRIILNSSQSTSVKVSILFHPDQETMNKETNLEILSSENDWFVPITWQ